MHLHPSTLALASAILPIAEPRLDDTVWCAVITTVVALAVVTLVDHVRRRRPSSRARDLTSPEAKRVLEQHQVDGR